MHGNRKNYRLYVLHHRWSRSSIESTSSQAYGRTSTKIECVLCSSHIIFLHEEHIAWRFVVCEWGKHLIVKFLSTQCIVSPWNHVRWHQIKHCHLTQTLNFFTYSSWSFGRWHSSQELGQEVLNCPSRNPIFQTTPSPTGCCEEVHHCLPCCTLGAT